MSWLEKIRPKGPATNVKDRTQNVPEGIWTKCPKCSSPLYRPELEKNLFVCPKCQHHIRISARKRIDISTPSHSQVISPLYTGSVDRWKNYEKQFEKVKKILDPWVNEFNF